MRPIIRFPQPGTVKFCAVAAIAACAPATQTVYIAATPQTVESRLEAARTGNAQYVVVANHSSQPIFVTAVRLQECRNVKKACETHPMRVSVPPGQRRNVFTVEVDNENMPSGFRYSTAWEVAAAELPALP